jgi:hypothetical protein
MRLATSSQSMHRADTFCRGKICSKLRFGDLGSLLRLNFAASCCLLSGRNRLRVDGCQFQVIASRAMLVAVTSNIRGSNKAWKQSMAKFCRHLAGIRDVLPSALGCEECLKIGEPWLHLRVCRTCGHVGCCDQSPGRHATKHFHATRHPIIEAYDPPEGWGWCYVDEVMFDLSDRPTPHLGPIPRYY